MSKYVPPQFRNTAERDQNPKENADYRQERQERRENDNTFYRTEKRESENVSYMGEWRDSRNSPNRTERRDWRDGEKTYSRSDRRDDRALYKDWRDNENSHSRADRRDNEIASYRGEGRENENSYSRGERYDNKNAYPREERLDNENAYSREERRDNDNAYSREERCDNENAYSREERRDNENAYPKEAKFDRGNTSFRAEKFDNESAHSADGIVQNENLYQKSEKRVNENMPLKGERRENENATREEKRDFVPDNITKEEGKVARCWGEADRRVIKKAERDDTAKFVDNRRGVAASSDKTVGGESGSANSASSKIRVVQVDSLVLIKVLKHCRDNYPTAVNGQLLGMDVGDVLEVTNCFPLPQKRDVYNALMKKSEKDIDERVEEEFETYQDRLAELMHDLNVDCFTVGWYQTLSLGDLKNKDNIDSLVLYQELVDKAILLGFDPLLNAMGKMPFKGFRVSDEFLAKYREAEEDVSEYNKLKAKDILVEVPIVIKNPLLVEAYLTEWASVDTFQYLSDFDALELDQNDYLEKNLNFLADSLDELGAEQEKLNKFYREYTRYQATQRQLIERRKLENDQRSLRGEPLLPMEFDGPAFKKMPPPSQIHTLLMSNQISMQCKEIAQISKENLGKMFLLNKTNVNVNQSHK